MTEKDMMILLGAHTSLPARFAYAAIGVLALFFPGYVAVAFLKATSTALQKLSFEQRCALANVLQLD